jgi:TATA-box binding protein (TBP) (component of TFIID and TFIIIB)
MTSVSKLTKDFVRTYNAISQVQTEHIKASPHHISTLTISVKFDRGDLPVNIIRERLAEEDGELTLAVPKVVKHRKTTAVASNTNMKKFDHQVSFKMGGSSLKMFCNGSGHGTGFSSFKDFLDMTHKVTEFILDVTGIELQIVDVNINMINASTSILDKNFMPVQFQMKQLSSIFAEEGHHTEFDPDMHPAVKVILFEDTKKVSTCFIFPTGSITIFGSKEPHHIASIFEIVFKTMDKAHMLATQCPPRKTTVRKPLDISFGYPTSTVKLLTL